MSGSNSFASRPSAGAGFCLVALMSVALGFGACSSVPSHAGDTTRGDAAWEARANGEQDGRASLEVIGEALGLYEAALTATPDDLSIRWKLLRALHFAGGFAATDDRDKVRFFDRAREVADQGVDQIHRNGDSPFLLEEADPREVRDLVALRGLSSSDVARLYFWSAINWGAWSRQAGLLSAVRHGVGNRLYRYTLVAIALEPDYEEGGAYRLLGRLHAELPKVPFVTAWVDRDQAVPLLERAYAQAPANPGNQLLLALTLLDLAPQRRTQALRLLQEVEGLSPRPAMHVEDLAMRKEAHKERLVALESGKP